MPRFFVRINIQIIGAHEITALEDMKVAWIEEITIKPGTGLVWVERIITSLLTLLNTALHSKD